MNNHGHTTLVICHVKQTQITVAFRLNGPNNPGQWWAINATMASGRPPNRIISSAMAAEASAGRRSRSMSAANRVVSGVGAPSENPTPSVTDRQSMWVLSSHTANTAATTAPMMAKTKGFVLVTSMYLTPNRREGSTLSFQSVRVLRN